MDDVQYNDVKSEAPLYYAVQKIKKGPVEQDPGS